MEKILRTLGVVGLPTFGGLPTEEHAVTAKTSTKAEIATAFTTPPQRQPILQLSFSSSDTTTTDTTATTHSLQSNSPYLDEQTNRIFNLFFSDIMNILQHDKNDEALRELRRILVEPMLHPRIPGNHNTTAFINRASQYLPQELLYKFNKAIDAQTQPLFSKDGFLAQGGSPMYKQTESCTDGSCSKQEGNKTEEGTAKPTDQYPTLQRLIDESQNPNKWANPDTYIKSCLTPLYKVILSLDINNNEVTFSMSEKKNLAHNIYRLMQYLGKNSNPDEAAKNVMKVLAELFSGFTHPECFPLDYKQILNSNTYQANVPIDVKLDDLTNVTITNGSNTITISMKKNPQLKIYQLHISKTSVSTSIPKK